jgi:hypothetical protein
VTETLMLRRTLSHAVFWPTPPLRSTKMTPPFSRGPSRGTDTSSVYMDSAGMGGGGIRRGGDGHALRDEDLVDACIQEAFMQSSACTAAGKHKLPR